MSKLFKPKTMRRIILSLFLLIPFFITFVPAIAFLAGAHGGVPIDTFSTRFVEGLFFFDNGFNLEIHSNPFLLMGYCVLSGEGDLIPLVFQPVSSLFVWLEGSTIFGQWGAAFADGFMDYLYCWFVGTLVYQISVVLIYEIVVIALKLLLLPLRAVEAFERKGDD